MSTSGEVSHDNKLSRNFVARLRNPLILSKTQRKVKVGSFFLVLDTSFEMKRFAIVAVFASFVLAVSCSKEGRCYGDEECKPGECCVHRGISGMRMGDCKPLSKEGEWCSDAMITGLGTAKYFRYCPCEEEMECEPKYKKLPLVEVLVKSGDTCVKRSATQDKVTHLTHKEVTQA